MVVIYYQPFVMMKASSSATLTNPIRFLAHTDYFVVCQVIEFGSSLVIYLILATLVSETVAGDGATFALRDKATWSILSFIEVGYWF